MQARKVLEPEIAAIAAPQITDEEIAVLDTCLKLAEECTEMNKAFLRADLDLHEAITIAARNPILRRLMASLSRLGRASRERTAYIPGEMATSMEDHREIVEALRVRNSKTAAAAMLRHIENVERRLLELV